MVREENVEPEGGVMSTGVSTGTKLFIGCFLGIIVVLFAFAVVGGLYTRGPTTENALPNGSMPVKELQLQAPKDASPAARSLLERSWPKVKRAMPGLDRYADSLSVVGVQDGLMLEESYRKVTVEVMVAEGRSSVPSEYKAIGQHCFLEIDPAGENVSVTKRACKAVLLDQVIYGTVHDSSDEMVLNLK